MTIHDPQKIDRFEPLSDFKFVILVARDELVVAKAPLICDDIWELPLTNPVGLLLTLSKVTLAAVTLVIPLPSPLNEPVNEPVKFDAVTSPPTNKLSLILKLPDVSVFVVVLKSYLSACIIEPVNVCPSIVYPVVKNILTAWTDALPSPPPRVWYSCERFSFISVSLRI